MAALCTHQRSQLITSHGALKLRTASRELQKLSDLLLAPVSAITQALESTERAEKARRTSA